MATSKKTTLPLLQLFRYGVVGLVSNGLLYGGYLLLTHYGWGAKSAMTLLYVLGVLQSFYFNRSWTFGHEGGVTISLARYICCYLIGYGFHWTMLYLLVDQVGWPHRIVQAGLILVTAGLLFLIQRFWVFPEKRASLPNA